MKALASQLGSDWELRVGLTVAPNRRDVDKRRDNVDVDRKWVREAKGDHAEEEPGAESGSCCGIPGPAGAGGAGLVGGGGSKLCGGTPVQFGCVINVSMIALLMVHKLECW